MPQASGEATRRPTPDAGSPPKAHCDLCLSTIAEGRTERLVQGERYAFCCPGCAQVFEILGSEEARRLGPGFKRGGGEGELPPGPYLEVWLKVEGIACGSCAPLVEGLLQQREGVVKAVVEPVSETAQVLYAPSRVSKDGLREHLGRYGYGAREVDQLDDDQPGIHEALRLVLAFVLGANAMMNAMVMYAAFARDNGTNWFADLIFEQRIYDPNPMPGTIRNAFTVVTGLTAIPVLLYCGWPILVNGWRRLRLGSPNVDTLVGFGAVMAFVVSLYTALVLHAHHVYFDTASMLVALLVIGRAFEGGAKRKASRAISGLLRLGAKAAEKLVDGTWREVDLGAIRPGDRLRVKLGERIPVDGEVLAGEGWVDASTLTGEPRPVAVTPGGTVLAGSLLTQGTLELRADKVGADTLLSQIVARVRQTLLAKAPLQQLADRIAAGFMPIVLAAALLAGLMAFARHTTGAQALMAGVAVLVVACPCALGIATPMVLLAAVSECAKRGLLLRGGEVLERAPQLKAIVFDKTGTLTTGQLELRGVRLQGMPEDEALALAAALEEVSTHPLAAVLYREGAARARAAGRELPALEDLAVRPGLGVEGRLQGQAVRIGRPAWLQELGVLAPEAWRSGDGLEGSLVMLAVGDRAAALWGLGDAVRADAAVAVRALKRQGVQPWLVSGDRLEACLPVAAAVGIDPACVVGGALPAEKADRLAVLQAQLGPTAMVGDGINDAVALSQSDLGIALGSGASVALESASVVLVHRDLRRIPLFLKVARLSVKRIRQNLFWAFAYNAVLIPLAVAGWVHPILAAGAMMASSLSVILNSGRKLGLEAKRRDLEHEGHDPLAA
ncbi:MAG TPA: heavy metal translocating P-type ATPase [Holophagaceae bacterium]|nr:heavy metal translocating P-type ATPase [Holophagaceae bacterium]